MGPSHRLFLAKVTVPPIGNHRSPKYPYIESQPKPSTFQTLPLIVTPEYFHILVTLLSVKKLFFPVAMVQYAVEMSYW